MSKEVILLCTVLQSAFPFHPLRKLTALIRLLALYNCFVQRQEVPPEAEEPEEPYVRVIDPAKPMLALTFDDGPHETYTGQILDILEEAISSVTVTSWSPCHWSHGTSAAAACTELS